MKFKRLLFIGILLFFIMGAVSAEDNTTAEIAESPQEDILGEDAPVELIENENYKVIIPEEISSGWIDTVEVRNMPWDVTGNISISVDGDEKYNQEVSVGRNCLIINTLNLDYGISHDVLVNYTGDMKYLGFIKKGTMNPMFSVDVSEYPNAGDTLNVEFTKDLTGTIKVLIDNKEVYNALCSKGKPKISLDKYSLSTHEYEVIYTKANTTLSKKGLFTRTNFYFTANSMTSEYDNAYGDNVTFEVDLPKNAKGTARFKNQTYEFTGKEYEYSIVEMNDFDIGDNIVEFTATYKGVTQRISKHILIEPKITMPTLLYVNGKYNLTFYGPSDFNGYLKLEGMISGEYKVENGTVTIPLSDLKCGEYDLKATYENYTWDYDIWVSKDTPKLEITVNYPEIVYEWDWANNYEDTPLYTIELYSNYALAGTTTVTHDNTTKKYGGEMHTTMEPYFNQKGKHTITVAYSGDTNIAPVNRTFTYEVRDYECELTYENTVYVSLPGSESGTLTVNVDGKKFKSKTIKATGDIVESYEIDLSSLKSPQNHDIEVIYKGKKISFKYDHARESTYRLNITSCGEYRYGDEYDHGVEFILPSDAEEFVEVFIEGEERFYSAIDEELAATGYVPKGHDIFSIPVDDLSPGTHTVVVSYPGDKNYPSKTVNATFNVTAEIRLDDVEPILGSSIRLSLYLPNDAEGNLTALIRYAGESEFKLFKKTDIYYGVGEIYLPSNRTGKYDFIAYYEGNYSVENLSGSIHIDPELTVPGSMRYNENKVIRAVIENTTNAKLFIYVCGENYIGVPIAEYNLNETTVIRTSDFMKKIRDFYLLNNKASGETRVYLSGMIFDESGGYDFYTYTAVEFENRIIGLKSISMYYGDAKYITFKVYDIYNNLVKGQNVKITIGKNTFEAKTDKNGAVKFKVPDKITPGTFKITVTYKTAKSTAKIKVVKVLSLKTAKVKRSAKKLVLTATLKKGKKAIKGKTIKFKFNGKTYKAKTNKYGIAKVTIKKTVLKKLKVGKKITYQATYLKDTIKKTAKVKK